VAEEKKKLFRLKEPDEIRVKLLLEQDGEEIEVFHIFRPPNAEDKKAYYGHGAYLENVDGASRQYSNMVEAAELLYGRCIRNVEGYATEGIADWKSQILLEHKRAAVAMLISRVSVIGGEIEKN